MNGLNTTLRTMTDPIFLLQLPLVGDVPMAFPSSKTHYESLVC